MASECTEEAIVDFMRARGGRVKNVDLIGHFKDAFPEEPGRKAAARELFKKHVDNVAFVKAECGVKYVCLKKRFRGSTKERRSCSGQVSDAQVDPAQPRVAATCRQQTSSGCGNDSDAIVQNNFKGDYSACREFVCVAEEADSSSAEMGNTYSLRGEKERGRKEPDKPEVSVTEASPLPVQGSAFTMPGPVQTGSQADAAPAVLSPTYGRVETPGEHNHVASSGPSCEGPQGRFLSGQADAENAEDEAQFETRSLSGSEGNSTPKCSRRHFIQVMVDSSPQVRRSRLLHTSVYQASRADNDSASLVSSSPDDDRALVTLDPLEHEWMICASDGKWGGLYRLLTTEPSLVLRKDFVTGFTCLHWAAKHGNPELIALILNFAKTHNIPISVDIRSNTGYTPLHVAAMHNHMEVVKLLVGAYNADVEIRDYSGRKACQYLTDNVSVDIRDIIGAYEQAESEDTDRKDGGRWRISRVLQSNLMPIRLLGPNDCDTVDVEHQPREKPLMRKSSFNRMKPKLQKLRMRTSQIVHSISFRDTEELNGSMNGSFKSRPKTHFFG